MRDIEDETPEVMAALDAMEAGHPDASRLLVGIPATVAIGSDRYAARVLRATPSLKTIEVEDEHGNAWMVFRLTKRGYRRGHYILSLGHSRPHWDPHF